MGLLYSMVSFLFYLFYRIKPAEWLIAVVLAWWGVVRSANGKSATAWFIMAVMMVLVGLAAKSMDYVLFVPSEGRTPRGALDGPIDALATGPLLGYLHPSLPLLTERFHLAACVRVFWMERDRPPHLLIVEPRSATLPIRHESGARWSTWYPGSTVAYGTVYQNGHELPGLNLSFCGQRLVLVCANEEAAAAIGGALALPEN